MSVQRRYAQRNGNNTTLIPVRYSEDLTFGNITNAAIYTLNISNSQFVGGIYTVDLSAVDSSGNSLNFDGEFTSITAPGDSIPIICFVINVDAVPSVYPGLELTIYFKNAPTDGPFSPTIGILASSALTGDTIPLPYIVSPPFPIVAGVNISSNITLKSDSDNFDVVASGPAGWLGVPALSAILTAYIGIP
jgi:hypothetical protein